VAVPDEGGLTFGLETVTDALNRRKWLVLTVFLCFSTLGFSGVSHLPEIYRASSMVIIENQWIPVQLVRSTVTSSVESRLQTITEEILSRSRLQEYIERFDLYRESRGQGVSTEALSSRMRGDIDFVIHRDGGNRTNAVAFTVGYRGPDPERVAEVTNFLASLYVGESVKLREEQAEGISDFLAAQLEEVRTTLDEHETTLTRFKERHLGELPHQQEANLASMDQLNSQFEANEKNQVEVSARRQSAVKELATLQGITTDGTDPGGARLAEMKLQLAQLRAMYTEKHPDVVRLKDDVALLERTMSRGGGASSQDLQASDLPIDPVVAQLEAAITEADRRLGVLQTEAERLRERAEMYQERLDNAPRVEQQYQLLSRDYETTLALYRSLLDRENEAQLAESMERGQKGEQMKIVESAVVPGQPAAPDRPLLYLITIGLSLGLAAGAVMLAEMLDSSYHSVDELRLTGISIVGSIPRIVTDADRRRSKWAFILEAACLLLVLAALATGAFLFADGNFELTSRLAL